MAALDQRDRGDRAGSGAVRFALTTGQCLGQAPARVLVFGGLLVLARFVLGAGAVLSGEAPLFPGWFVALLGGFCLAVVLWVLVTGRAHAALEQAGIWREGVRDAAFVPWSDVVAVKQARLLDARWVSLRRRDGRRIWLPAPATSVLGRDPEFRDKVETVRGWWTQYGARPGWVSRRRIWRRRLPLIVVFLFALGWLTVQILRYDIQPGREVVRELPDSCTVLDGATALRDVRQLPPRHEGGDRDGADVDRCEWGAGSTDPDGRGTGLAVELRRYDRSG